jgi:carnitine 3-dehydrogenase
MAVAQTRPDCVALLGFGNVGLGWAANYLAKGFEVRAYDPAAGAKARAAKFLSAAWPSLQALGLTEAAEYPADRLIIVGTGANAVRGASFIHENGPEDVAVKRAILSEAEDAADANVIIASSSGGLPPSTLQAEMQRPERFVIAHPFNPPHIVPLVEVLGGSKTAPAAIEKTISHLRKLGKHPIKLEREMTAYLTNRLQFALLREAAHCLVEGVASAEAIEDAVKYGLAPRWMVMGSLMTLTLAGGPGGMPRVMESFSGAIDSWWQALGSPRMTAEVKAALLRAADTITQGRALDGLIALRDENLVALLRSAAKLSPM